MGKLTKAQRRCLTQAAQGYVGSPAQGPYRKRGEANLIPWIFSRRTLRSLTDQGLLAHVDIDTRRITDAGRAALQKDTP